MAVEIRTEWAGLIDTTSCDEMAQLALKYVTHSAGRNVTKLEFMSQVVGSDDSDFEGPDFNGTRSN